MPASSWAIEVGAGAGTMLLRKFRAEGSSVNPLRADSSCRGSVTDARGLTLLEDGKAKAEATREALMRTFIASACESDFGG
jgi:hypothetical protein